MRVKLGVGLLKYYLQLRLFVYLLYEKSYKIFKNDLSPRKGKTLRNLVTVT